MNNSCIYSQLKGGEFVDFSSGGKVHTWTKVHTGAWQSTHYGPALFAYFGEMLTMMYRGIVVLLRFNRSYVWLGYREGFNIITRFWNLLTFLRS